MQQATAFVFLEGSPGCGWLLKSRPCMQISALLAAAVRAAVVLHSVAQARALETPSLLLGLDQPLLTLYGHVPCRCASSDSGCLSARPESLHSFPEACPDRAALDEPFQLILTWQGRYHDHEGGSPRVRLAHCTAGVLTPAISPNAGNSTA